MKIAVAGATGRVGSRVVELLETSGHDVVPISRSTGVNVVTGEGLAKALVGVECVIDAASGTARGKPGAPQAAHEFFTTAARNLHEFGRKAGVQRMVEVSVIGINHFTTGQGAAKYTHEKTMLAGPIPVRVLRAAQFHEFVPQLIEWGTQGELAHVREMRVQSVAARAVAQALVDMATDSTWAASPTRSEPPIPEIAGPREETLVDMAELYVVWNYWVNNYLLGRPPPAFDILYWNSDTTRMPARLHHDFLRIATANALVSPDAATMLGTPVDLGKVDADSYVVAGVADHICPWQSCFQSTQLLGGASRFVLSTSGHIAALVNPPDNPKASFQAGDQPGPDAEGWGRATGRQSGSWWPDYVSWLTTRSGSSKRAPRSLGGRAFEPREPAPGTYVFDK
jgi:hypothetical protein